MGFCVPAKLTEGAVGGGGPEACLTHVSGVDAWASGFEMTVGVLVSKRVI